MSYKSKLNPEGYVFIDYTYNYFSKYCCISSTKKSHKHSFGERSSKFLSKLLWHFSQVVPSYSNTDSRPTRSPEVHGQKLVIDEDHDQSQYPKYYRMYSIRQRNSTLMSIEEENENEIVNKS